MSKRSRHRSTPAPAPSAPAPAKRARRSVALALIAAAVAAIGGLLWWTLAQSPAPPPNSGAKVAAPVVAEFIGSEACAGCHRAEHSAWQGSQHARAMQHANPETVRGNFNEAKFSYAGVTSTFSMRDGKYFVRTDGTDGKPAEFEVKYTYGLEPLQQYLIELPGGKIQALSIAWDTRETAKGGQRWFHLYPDEKIDFRDELHWTKRTQNWNFMCADCHSTNVRKGYDAANDSFATAWSEMTVGCESCHGPGSAHVAWTRDKPTSDTTKGLTVALDERRGVAWRIDATTGNATRSPGRQSEREIEVCAPCHSRRAQIAEGHRAGQPFLDHYLPSMLIPGLYHADGQQRDEVYIWASFLQSRMYRAGVTCSDCHDPHTQKLRAEGNTVCGQCHAAPKYDARSHHQHEPSSRAGQCVSCHMPATPYMVVDPRRDHSMRVPRPDRTVALGVPNACNDCHREADAKWAAAAIRRWFGADAKGFQAFAETFRGAELGKPQAAASLAIISDDIAQSPIARASALERLSAFADPASVGAAQRGARDASPLVRLAAVRLTGSLAPDQRASIAAALLGDPLRAVRIESARVLAPVVDSLTPEQRARWELAAAEYIATQKYNADRPEARSALGTFHADRGQFDLAQAAFASARALDPDFLPAYLNAADAYRTQGRESEAQRLLEEGLAKDPRSAPLHHSLGLSYAREKKPAPALASLQRAAELAPEERRYTYVYAVALNTYGRASDAVRTLERAAKRWPGDRDILIALATMQRDAGRPDAARRTAESLVAAHPDDREARALLQALR
jgi:tetratricopeptide (TPR) repeat protein